MSLGLLLQKQQAAADVAPLQAIDFNNVTMRIESAFRSLECASRILGAAKNHKLNNEQIRLGFHQLNMLPAEFVPSNLRIESHQVSSNGLIYRAEGIIDSIIESISKFFKWIGSAFSKLFGGGDGGAPAATAATEAASTVAAEASSNGVDEFLFKENNPLFKMLDLNDLPRCHKFCESVVTGARTLVELNKKAIEFSNTSTKDYQGQFDKDAMDAMRPFCEKTTAYAKEQVGNSVEGQYFAVTVSFLTAVVAVFGENKVTLPSGESDAKSGKGYTPKEVYISVSDWKSLVNIFGNTSKTFFDCGEQLKKLSESYKSLDSKVKTWKDMEPEEVRRVGAGLTELNKVASFVFRGVKVLEHNMNTISSSLKAVSENDLRKQAKKGREDESEKAKKEAEKAKVGETVNQGAHTNVD